MYIVYTYDELAGEVQDKVTFETKEEAEAERLKRQEQYDDFLLYKTAYVIEV